MAVTALPGPPTPPGPPITQLRVYEPLEAFTPEIRHHWERYAVSAPAVALLEQWERRESWRRVVGGGPLLPAAEDPGHARVLRLNGVLLVCPLQLTLRARAAAREAARNLPPVVTAGIDPVWGAEHASAGAEAPSGHDPSSGPGGARPGGARDLRLRTLVAPWAMPWGWLLLVRPDEHREHSGTYVAPMSRARSRAARALKLLREHFDDAQVTEEVEDVARWLEDFHPRSLIELDERCTAAVAGPGGVEDVLMGLQSLAEGDATGVAAAYQRLDRRSRRLQGLSRAS